MARVSFLPKGYNTITPYLMVRDAARAIEWYKTVLGAQELFRMPMPDGKLGHAEIKIGDTILMMADEQGPHRGPQSLGGTSVGLMIYVENVDAIFNRALQNGATQVQGVSDKFYGDRSGSVRDPFGHMWTIGTHVEDVSPEEMEKRMAQAGPHGEK